MRYCTTVALGFFLCEIRAPLQGANLGYRNLRFWFVENVVCYTSLILVSHIRTIKEKSEGTAQGVLNTVHRVYLVYNYNS